MEQAEHFKRVAQVLEELSEEMQYKLTGTPSPRIIDEWYEADCRDKEQKELDEFEKKINHGLTFKECSNLAKELLKLCQNEEDEYELPIDSAARAMEMDELLKKLHIDWSKIE